MEKAGVKSRRGSSSCQLWHIPHRDLFLPVAVLGMSPRTHLGVCSEPSANRSVATGPFLAHTGQATVTPSAECALQGRPT